MGNSLQTTSDYKTISQLENKKKLPFHELFWFAIDGFFVNAQNQLTLE
jgi:hypothetical protein